MKHYILSLLAVATFVFGAISCKNVNNTDSSAAPAVKGQVKVFYFHGPHRCKTCMAIEALTKEVVSTCYAAEVKKGKVVFKSIDISTPEGEKQADSYEVSWSSLVLDKDGKCVNLTDMAFSYAKSEPDTFKSKLYTEINRLMK